MVSSVLCFILLLISISLSLPSRAVFAHGEGYWNDFMINNKLDLAASTLDYVRKELADIGLVRRKVTVWPDPVFRRLNIELIVLQEELEALLVHLQEEDGIHLQLPTTLREHPQAGRAVAASYAVEMAMELVDYVASLEDQNAFEEELHEHGTGSYIFDLMDAYADTMAVYQSLQQKTLEIAEKDAAIAVHDSRTLWQDLRFHLGRFFRWLGQAGVADALQQLDSGLSAESINATSE